MIYLIFNTTEKTAKVQNGIIVKDYDNILTIKPENGYYELIQGSMTNPQTRRPILRLPINNTIMEIKN